MDAPALEVPDNESVGIVTGNTSNDHFFISLTGFLTPSSLLLGDAAGTSLKPAKTLPPQFDASRDVVEQFDAVSKDGTRVPYFVVHPKGMKYDGTNPDSSLRLRRLPDFVDAKLFGDDRKALA